MQVAPASISVIAKGGENIYAGKLFSDASCMCKMILRVRKYF
jgi:hypothetical protein